MPTGFFSYLQMEHKKRYSNEVEERFRLKIFNENRLKIAKHNQLYATGKASFKMAINKYTDMLHSEFRETMNGYNNTLRKQLRWVLSNLKKKFYYKKNLTGK